jgi:hypothetical protein
MAANARVAEVTAVGRILAEYNNLEIGLLHCVQMGTGNFDQTFKTMFRVRGETARINAARDLGRATYQGLGLEADFDTAIDAIRHALKIIITVTVHSIDAARRSSRSGRRAQGNATDRN